MVYSTASYSAIRRDVQARDFIGDLIILGEERENMEPGFKKHVMPETFAFLTNNDNFGTEKRKGTVIDAVRYGNNRTDAIYSMDWRLTFDPAFSTTKEYPLVVMDLKSKNWGEVLVEILCQRRFTMERPDVPWTAIVKIYFKKGKKAGKPAAILTVDAVPMEWTIWDLLYACYDSAQANMERGERRRMRARERARGKMGLVERKGGYLAPQSVLDEKRGVKVEAPGQDIAQKLAALEESRLPTPTETAAPATGGPETPAPDASVEPQGQDEANWDDSVQYFPE